MVMEFKRASEISLNRSARLALNSQVRDFKCRENGHIPQRSVPLLKNHLTSLKDLFHPERFSLGPEFLFKGDTGFIPT